MRRPWEIYLLGASLVVGSAAAVHAGGLTAVVAHVEGAVSVGDPADLSPGAAIRPLQVLSAGSIVTLAGGAHVGLVCSIEHLILLAGPGRWSLTAPGCAEGRELPLGSYDELALEAGRLRSLAGVLALSPGIRAEDLDDPRVPILLTPRGPNVLDERPVCAGAERAALKATCWRSRGSRAGCGSMPPGPAVRPSQPGTTRSSARCPCRAKSPVWSRGGAIRSPSRSKRRIRLAAFEKGHDLWFTGWTT